MKPTRREWLTYTVEAVALLAVAYIAIWAVVLSAP